MYKKGEYFNVISTWYIVRGYGYTCVEVFRQDKDDTDAFGKCKVVYQKPNFVLIWYRANGFYNKRLNVDL